jgi:hypothetical protein
MRKTLAILSLAFAGTALAQPAAPPPTGAPEPPPPDVTAPPKAEPPPVEVKAPPTANPDSPPPKPPEPAALSKKLAVGKEGTLQLGALLQGWFIAEHASTTTSTFRIRRAELSFKGEIVPKQVGYAVMIDPAKVREFNTVTVMDAMGMTTQIKTPGTAVSVLQDFFITAITKYADASIGQFKFPVSWEGYNSSSKIIMPERALSSVAFGDKRDLGIRIAKTFPKWGYSFGVFNGAALNNLDGDNQKDVALRLEAYPVKGLTLAGVAYDSLFKRELPGSKDRWEADVRYEAGPILVQAEYIRARDGGTSKRVTGQGGYLAAAYTVEAKELGGQLQPVVRIGYLDSNVDINVPATGADEVLHYDIGLNYYLRAHEMKLQGSYQRQQFDEKTANNQFIVAAQVSY